MGTGAFILLNQPRCLPVPGFFLEDGTFICGRSSRCHLILPHQTVSRRHAQLEVAGPRVDVVDLDSRNGTFVDGERVDSATIRPGEILTLGEVSFVLLDSMDVDDDSRACCETMSTRDVRPSPAAGSPVSALSAAQRRVLELVVEGLAEKQIATRLKISRHTAHNHVRNIYRVLGVHSRAELLAKLVSKEGGEGLTGIAFPRRLGIWPET